MEERSARANRISVNNSGRLLFFDLFRIIAVGMVVFGHLAFYMPIQPFNVYIGIPNIYYMDIASIGVTILLIISGAVLEYNYKSLSNIGELIKFYIKRICRLYPAFWMAFTVSVIITLAYNPLFVLKQGLFELLLQASGFYAFTGKDLFGGYLLGVGWFIGLIIVFYLFFPLISRLLKWQPIPIIIGMFIMSFGLKYYFNITYPGSTLEYWFPLCRIFEFGLGVFIVQQSLYPKITYKSSLIKFLAEMSFTVFLTHQLIIYLSKINFMFYLFSVLLLSLMVYALDEKIQAWVRDRLNKVDLGDPLKHLVKISNPPS